MRPAATSAPNSWTAGAMTSSSAYSTTSPVAPGGRGMLSVDPRASGPPLAVTSPVPGTAATGGWRRTGGPVRPRKCPASRCHGGRPSRGRGPVRLAARVPAAAIATVFKRQKPMAWSAVAWCPGAGGRRRPRRRWLPPARPRRPERPDGPQRGSPGPGAGHRVGVERAPARGAKILEHMQVLRGVHPFQLLRRGKAGRETDDSLGQARPGESRPEPRRRRSGRSGWSGPVSWLSSSGDALEKEHRQNNTAPLTRLRRSAAASCSRSQRVLEHSTRAFPKSHFSRSRGGERSTQAQGPDFGLKSKRNCQPGTAGRARSVIRLWTAQPFGGFKLNIQEVPVVSLVAEGVFLAGDALADEVLVAREFWTVAARPTRFFRWHRPRLCRALSRGRRGRGPLPGGRRLLGRGRTGVRRSHGAGLCP